MLTRSLAIFLIALAMFAVLAPAQDAPPSPAPDATTPPDPVKPGARYKVDTFGSAPKERPNAREDAINDALRRAVEQAAGIKLESWSSSQDMALVSDYIITQSCGIVESYTVIAENPDQDGLYTVRIQAITSQSKADIDQRLMAFETLMHQVGRPRMMLVGSVDGRPFDDWVTRALEDTLDKRGFTVMSLANLEQRKREDIERKTQVDHDGALAAMIDSEIKADYYVIVTTQLQESPPAQNDVTGLTMYPIGATAGIEVVQRDNSHLMASKTVDVPQFNYRDPITGRRKAATAAAQAALEQAITRIAQHWLHDYNGRHSIGGDIEVILDRFSFDRMSNLIQTLRKSRDIQRVDVDNMDEKGRSSLRVSTKLSAADVAMTIKQIDPTLSGMTLTKNQIEIGEVVNPFTPVAAAAPPAPESPHPRFDMSLIMRLSFFVSGTLAGILGLIVYIRRRAMY